MPDEEPGLLGNLPRSRPGTRSDKRGSAQDDPKDPDAPAAKAGSTASKPAPKRAQAAKRAGGAKEPKGADSVKSKAPAKATPGTTRATGKPAPTPAGRKGAPTSRPVPIDVAEPSDARPENKAPRSGPLASAAKVAGTGIRVAEGVTREVLWRLPRP